MKLKTEQNIQTYDYANFKEKFILEKQLLPADALGFKIFKIEEASKHIKFPLPLHRTKYYDILFMKKGRSSKNCGLKKYTINGGELFFKPANQITSGDVFTKNVSGYFCVIENDFISSYLGFQIFMDSFSFFKYGHHPILTLNEHDQNKFDFIFSNLHSLSIANARSNNALIASWLNVLLQEANLSYQNVMNLLSINLKTNNEELVSRYKDLIAQNYISTRSVSDYANMLFVTPNHLNRVIKMTTGRTASSFINEMLLLDAKILLTQTTHTVSEIASILKFNDPSYFNRFFKKHSGATPVSFRENA